MDAADTGPRRVTGLQAVGLPVELRVDAALGDEVGLFQRMVVRAGDPPGTYWTMNMVSSCAPRSVSTIIFTVMPL